MEDKQIVRGRTHQKGRVKRGILLSIFILAKCCPRASIVKDLLAGRSTLLSFSQDSCDPFRQSQSEGKADLHACTLRGQGDGRKRLVFLFPFPFFKQERLHRGTQRHIHLCHCDGGTEFEAEDRSKRWREKSIGVVRMEERRESGEGMGKNMRKKKKWYWRKEA